MAFLEILNDHFSTQLNFIPIRRDRVLDLVITNLRKKKTARSKLKKSPTDHQQQK